jgi:hypothetical protein
LEEAPVEAEGAAMRMPKTRRAPATMIAVLAGALLMALALGGYVLWPRHDATAGRASDAFEVAPPLKATSERSDDGERLPPMHSAPAPSGEPNAVEPTGTDGGSPGDCEESSFRFRQVVAPCFRSDDLCDVGVSVRFDANGRASDVSFLADVPPAIAEQARAARACVERSFAKLTTPCSRSKSVHYTERCTLR